MDLLIILAGPAILLTGLYVNDRLAIGIGALYTGLFVVAYFLRRHNQEQAERDLRHKQNQLIEQFADDQQAKSDRHIDR